MFNILDFSNDCSFSSKQWISKYFVHNLDQLKNATGVLDLRLYFNIKQYISSIDSTGRVILKIYYKKLKIPNLIFTINSMCMPLPYKSVWSM